MKLGTRIAFVAPAFEIDKTEESKGLPSDKNRLLQLYNKDVLRQVRI